MFIAYIILAIVRTVFITLGSISKLQHAPRVMRIIVQDAKVPVEWLPWLAICEIAGGIGILIGIAVVPLGIVAASGLVLYMIGAVVAHVRAGDFKGTRAPAPLLLLSVAVLVTRILA